MPACARRGATVTRPDAVGGARPDVGTAPGRRTFGLPPEGGRSRTIHSLVDPAVVHRSARHGRRRPHHRRLMAAMRTTPGAGIRQAGNPCGLSQSARRVSNDKVHVDCDHRRRAVLGRSSDWGSPMMSNRGWRAAIVFGVLGVGLVTGCTTPGVEPSPSTSTPATSPASPSPTPTVPPEVAEAEELILEAYEGYWTAKVASYADPTQPQDPNLAVYAIDTALTDAQATLATMLAEGIRVPGEPIRDPVVSEIELGATPSARITDCVDITNWQGIFVATGDSAVAPDQNTRVVAMATVTVYDGRWVLDTYSVERDRSC